jgi:hypothetical protein
MGMTLPKPWTRAAFVACWITGCGSSATTDADAALPTADASTLDRSPPPPSQPGYAIDVLRESTFVLDGRRFPVTLARVRRPDGRATYVQFIASDRAGKVGAVVATQPYTGVDWSDDPVDARWAAKVLPEGIHLEPDDDGPRPVAGRTAIYERRSLDSLNAQASLHALNGLSTLLVFGRFYAGGSVRDEIADMAAGTYFLAEQGTIDLARVGFFGGSWGGFEALYAAANADLRIKPAAVAAAYPIVDFATWLSHVATREEPARGLLAAHVARVTEDTQRGDFSGLRVEDLCVRLDSKTLVLHDVHDNLVPVEQSQRLSQQCGAQRVEWPRAPALPDPADPTHGPLLREVDSPLVPSWFAYANVFLHTALLAPSEPIYEWVEEEAVRVHLELVHAAQQRGERPDWMAPRLRELVRPTYFEARTGSVMRGDELVARLVNRVWGTSFLPSNVLTGLASGLPPAR